MIINIDIITLVFSVEEIRKKLEETKTTVAPPCAPPPPPPPPPPMSMPPPPPPPMTSTPNLRTIKLKTVSTLNHTNGDSNAIEDIENYLGLQPANAGPQVQNGKNFTFAFIPICIIYKLIDC